MSSILDALNKLEEEKKEAARTAAEAAIDPRVAARELVGGTAGRRGTHGSPVMWALAGIGVFSVVATAAAFGAYFVLKPAVPSQTAGLTAPALEHPIPAPPADEGSSDADAEPGAAETVAAQNAGDANSTEAATAAVKDEPSTAKPARAEPLPKPFEVASNALPKVDWVEASATTTVPADATPAVPTANETPKPEPPSVVKAAPLPPAAETVEPPAPAAANPGPLPSDISKLPVLRESDKGRIGFDAVDINMLQPQSKSRPYAKAIINLKPVMLLERIPGTRTTLIGVEHNGIAIEVVGSRERYFVPFGFSL